MQLLESRAYTALQNVTRARAALTTARTNANVIYCPPRLQAQLDLQAGILHAEEGDFKTAVSYFFEAVEGFDSINSPKAIVAMKYLLLFRVMLGLVDDVSSVVSGKLALRCTGRDIDAMRAVTAAYKNRSLNELQQALHDYNHELNDDAIVASHLAILYDSLLEQNLLRLIEPFSCVQVAHIAELIKLPLGPVEQKLSHMILDRKFSGILDQGSGCLEIFEEAPQDQTCTASLNTIQEMNRAVDALYERAQKLQH